jgi:uncharacterized membrane protein YdbT with pleckstrin-like domain
MQHKQFDEQLEGEEVVFVFRKHPVVMRRGLILGLLGPLIGIIPTAIWPQLGYTYFFGGLIAGVVLGFLLFMPSFIAWYFSVIIVTDQRFIQVSRKGLFSKSIVDLSLNQIQSVNYEVRGLQETLLGYGTLLIQTYIGDLVIQNVEKPAKIYTQMLETLRDLGIEPVNLGAETQKDTAEDEES